MEKPGIFNKIYIYIDLLWFDYFLEMTLEKVMSFIPQLLSKIYIEMLIYGNTTKQVKLLGDWLFLEQFSFACSKKICYLVDM